MSRCLVPGVLFSLLMAAGGALAQEEEPHRAWRQPVTLRRGDAQVTVRPAQQQSQSGKPAEASVGKPSGAIVGRQGYVSPTFVKPEPPPPTLCQQNPQHPRCQDRPFGIRPVPIVALPIVAAPIVAAPIVAVPIVPNPGGDPCPPGYEYNGQRCKPVPRPQDPCPQGYRQRPGGRCEPVYEKPQPCRPPYETAADGSCRAPQRGGVGPRR